jgi:hypothetical protein
MSQQQWWQQNQADAEPVARPDRANPKMPAAISFFMA